MTVNRGTINKGSVTVSASGDAVTIQKDHYSRIKLLTGGMYIDNQSVNLSLDEAIELAAELVKMVNDG